MLPFQVASPTFSTTTSTPRRPVSANTAFPQSPSSRSYTCAPPTARSRSPLSAPAPRAVPTPQRGIDHHPLAQPPRIDPLPHRLHHPGHIAPTDVGHGGFDRHPPAHPEVEVVQRRGLHPQQQLARTGHGVGHL